MVMTSCKQLQERLAALHRASLDLVSDVSLESVLKRIAQEACSQTDAAYAAVGVVGEDGKLSQFVPVGMSEEEIQRMPHFPRGDGLIGVLMHGDQPVRVDHIEKDSRSAGFPDGHPVMTSFLGVPILQSERHLGQIYITNKRSASGFDNEDQQIIEMLAAYAAIAITNANLVQALQLRENQLLKRNENLKRMNDLASKLVASTDIDQILDEAMAAIAALSETFVSEVFLSHDDSKQFSLVKHLGDTAPALWAKNRFNLGEAVIGQTAQFAEISSLKVSDQKNGDELAVDLSGSIASITCFPLNGRRGVLGVLSLGFPEGFALQEPELQYVSTICSWIAMAIENVHLNMQQRRLAVLEERERIGMDLHDGVIQSIYAVGLILEHARLLMSEDTEKAYKRIEQAIADLNSTIRDIRSYILDLRPRQLHDENLMQGVRRLISEFRANTLVEVIVQGPEDGMAGLRGSEAVALFHICQEALANVAKHAHASLVHVNLWTTSDRVLLEVRDDGNGFDMDGIKTAIGHGLSNMETRARNVGGDVDISSEPGEGSTILAWVPNIKES